MDDVDLVRWLMSGSDDDLDELPRWPSWMLDAVCLSADPAAFFPVDGQFGTEAKRICAGCPVREPCLEYALEQEGPTAPREGRAGIWGGTTPNERRRIAAGRRRMMPAA